MSKQANKTLIGGFVVGGLLLAIIGILLFGSGRFFSETTRYVLYFDGSVKGLSEGAPVEFKGVKIGTVTEIRLLTDPKDWSLQIPVFIETDPGSFSIVGGESALTLGKAERLKATRQLIERGLRAQLQTQSMVTGQLMVTLDFHPDKPLKLVGDGTVPEIPTIPSTGEELSRSLARLNLQELAANLSSAVSGIERTVTAPEVKEAIRNLSEVVKDVRKLIQNLDSRIEPLAAGIDQTIKDYGKVARDVDRQIKPLGSGVNQTLKDIRGLVVNLDGVVKKIDAAAEPLPETLERMRKVSRRLDDLVANQTPNIERTLENVRASSQNVKELSERAKEDPSGVLFGQPPPPSRRRR